MCIPHLNCIVPAVGSISPRHQPRSIRRNTLNRVRPPDHAPRPGARDLKCERRPGPEQAEDDETDDDAAEHEHEFTPPRKAAALVEWTPCRRSTCATLAAIRARRLRFPPPCRSPIDTPLSPIHPR